MLKILIALEILQTLETTLIVMQEIVLNQVLEIITLQEQIVTEHAKKFKKGKRLFFPFYFLNYREDYIHHNHVLMSHLLRAYKSPS